MKKLSKKLLISIFTLVITVLAVGASTFAWFALSTTSQVSNIGGQVTIGAGMKVRLYHVKKVDGGDDIVTDSGWKSNLNDEDVTKFLTTIATNKFEFKAVNSLDGRTNFTKLALDSNGLLRLGQDTEANVDYLEFKIQFRSASEGTASLTKYDFDEGKNPLKIINMDTDKYLQYNANDNTVLSNHSVETKAAFGARVSFTTEDDINDPKFNTTVYQHAKTNSDGNLVLVTKEVEGEDIPTITGNYVMEQTGVVVGQWSYLNAGLGIKVYPKIGNDAFALPAGTEEGSQLLANALTETKDVEGDFITTVALKDSTVNTGTVENPVYTYGSDNANEKYFGEFDVRLWIEGWDADTYDVILTMPLYISLKFKYEEK